MWQLISSTTIALISSLSFSPPLAKLATDDRPSTCSLAPADTVPEQKARSSTHAPSANDTSLERLLVRLAALDEIRLRPFYISSPGMSATTPTAFGGSFGDFGVGVGIVSRVRYRDKADGVIGATLSLGDPARMGIDLGVTILDLRQDRSGRGGFGERGSMNLKLHRTIAGNVALAAGLENVANWGGTDAPKSAYAVASAMFHLGPRYFPSGPVHASVGVGTGGFRVTHNHKALGGFASLAIPIARPLTIIAEWSGQDLAFGSSIVPFRGLAAVVTVAVVDLTGNAGDGPRTIITAGYGHRIW